MTHSALGMLMVSGAALGASCQATKDRTETKQHERVQLPLAAAGSPGVASSPAAPPAATSPGTPGVTARGGASAGAPAAPEALPGAAPPGQDGGASKYENLVRFCQQVAYFRSKHLWTELHALASVAEQQRVSVQTLDTVFTELDEVAGVERFECVVERLLQENDAKSAADIEPLKNAMLPLRMFYEDRGSTSLQIWTVAWGDARWETDFSDL